MVWYGGFVSFSSLGDGTTTATAGFWFLAYHVVCDGLLGMMRLTGGVLLLINWGLW
jgi:hypothetical protein